MGEEIIVGRGRTPVAKLVRYAEPTADRRPGRVRGEIELAHDCDAALEEFAD